MRNRETDPPPRHAFDMEAEFVRRCRARREELGWSQRELARRLTEVEGVQMHQSSIAKLERDDDERRPIRLAEAIALSLTLEVPLWVAFANLDDGRRMALKSLERDQEQLDEQLADLVDRRENLAGQIAYLSRFDELLNSPAWRDFEAFKEWRDELHDAREADRSDEGEGDGEPEASA